jgi:YHS domain-containing protein
MATMTDPVCGKSVEADNSGEHVSYSLVMYYFCSADCREKFEADPARYVTDQQGKHWADTTAIPDDQKSHEPS